MRIVPLLVLALSVAGCGGGDDTPSSTTPAAVPGPAPAADAPIVQIHAVADVVERMPQIELVGKGENKVVPKIEGLIAAVQDQLVLTRDETRPTIAAQAGALVVKATRVQQEQVAQALDDIRKQLTDAGR